MSTGNSKLAVTALKQQVETPTTKDAPTTSKIAFVSIDAILKGVPADDKGTDSPPFHTLPLVIRSLGKLQDEYGYEIAIIVPNAEDMRRLSDLDALLLNEGIATITITAESTAELPGAVKLKLHAVTPDSVVVSRSSELESLASAFALTHHDLRLVIEPHLNTATPHVSQSEPDESRLVWQALAERLRPPHRVTSVHRVTKETDVAISLNLDGRGVHRITTGIGFFDHMLAQVSYHGLIDLEVTARGDLHIDEHHTVEDVGITLGRAVADALGDKRGIERFGYVCPLDDALARVTVDFSGRSFLVWQAQFQREKIGDLPTEMIQHFFRSFADEARCNIHVEMYGENDHHRAESIFKAFGRALHNAFVRSRPMTVPSTKGTL